MNAQFGRAEARGTDPDTGAECAKPSEVVLAVVRHLIWGKGAASRAERVGDSKEMLKRKGPKLGSEAGTGKHRTQGIADGLVGAFHGTVLVGGISASGTDIVAVLVEQGAHLRIPV